ncbi:MAG TPA: tRNA-uridine aminocarboxypropyltransferase [Planctomycetota bacterium]|nr:tRNA-uridine aminocarboxypropyltransferase [Planctomycetota bacterium]
MFAGHAVARLRAERLARSTRIPHARGSRCERCAGCRLPPTHCVCAWRPTVPARSGFCLLMHDIEPLKPSNTGWLVADIVPGTEAFPWTRTEIDPRVPALLGDPGWQPYVVFPASYAPSRAVTEVAPATGRRPLFVLLDATWPEARRMFRRSPYLDALPVLGLHTGQLSRYRLRQAPREGQLCTAEVAALCLALAGEERAARALDAWLDVFVAHSMDARNNRPAGAPGDAHGRLAEFVTVSASALRRP